MMIAQLSIDVDNEIRMVESSGHEDSEYVKKFLAGV
jgi:hypothetical protein